MTLSAAYKQIFGLPSGGGDRQGNRKSFRHPSHPQRICLRVIRHQDKRILQNIFYECCVEVHYGTLGSLSNDYGHGHGHGHGHGDVDGDGNGNGDGNENGKKKKQQLCTCIMLFCTFLSRRCRTTTLMFCQIVLWDFFIASHADVLTGSSTRDEPLRTFAWEANFFRDYRALIGSLSNNNGSTIVPKEVPWCNSAKHQPSPPHNLNNGKYMARYQKAS